MAIKDEMFRKIEQEIHTLIDQDRFNLMNKQDKVLTVAKMLTELSVSQQEAETLVNQYIAQIKNICKS